MDIGTLTGQIEIEDQLSGVLQGAANRIQSFSKLFGQMSTDLAKGGAAIAGSIIGISASIIALGNRGSDVNNVAATFENFSGSVENATDSLQRMREGALGTVSDFDLMSSSSKLLAGGVKLTSAEFGTLTRASFILQNQGLGNTKEMLDLVSQAMLTGRTRSLELRIGKIDLQKATRDYAASLGVEVSQLTETARTEARRTAILDALNRKVQSAGEQQRDFGEQMEFAIVKIKNWGDELSRRVASSQAITNAVSNIGKALQDAFGGAGQSAIEVIVSGIDKFANMVSSVAPRIISFVGQISPAIVSGIETVKNVIVEIWNQLVAFNDRWQITSNLVKGAQFAWGLLQKAFNLVEIAVEAVIDAWAMMPDWLRRITKGALESAAAMTAYSVTINAVATPFRALVESFDLGINIIGNLSGAIFNLQHLTWLWTKPIGAVTLAHKSLTTWLSTSTIATKAAAAADVEAAAIKTLFSKAIFALGNTVPVLTARIWLMEVATKTSAVTTGILTRAQVIWAGVLFTLGNSIPVLTARIWLMDVATKASTISMKAFGLAALAIQSLPLVAALTGIVIGLNEVRKAWVNLQKAREQGQTTWEFLSARDTDTWARRWINSASQFIAGVDIFETGTKRIEEIRKRLKGGPVPEGTIPEISPGALAGGSSEFQAAAAARAGIGLADDLSISDLVKDDTTEKINSMVRSWQDATKEASIFTSAFNRLTEAQRANFTIQEAIVPTIEKLRNSGQKVTPAMLAVRDAFMNTRLQLLETDKAILSQTGITQGLVDQEMRLGKSLADVAAAYGVAESSLSAYLAEASRAAEIEQNLQSFNAALLAQQDADRQRSLMKELEGNKAIAEADSRLQELLRQNSMTTVEFQIDQIDREAAARIASFKGTDQQVKEFTRVTLRESEIRKRGLMVDLDALKRFSKANLVEIMNTSYNTWRAMEDDPTNFSANVRAQFRKIYEDAREAATGVQSVWTQAFNALEGVSSIVGQLPGELANVSARAIDAGKNILKMFEGGFSKMKLISGIGEVIGATGEGGTLARTLGGAISGGVLGGAAAMAAWGSAAGPIGTAIGAAAGAVVGLVRGLTQLTEYEQRVRAEASAFEEIREEAIRAAGGMEKLTGAASLVGINIQGALTPRDPVFLRNTLDDIAKKTQILNQAMQDYGFTWEDMNEEARKFKFGEVIEDLAERMRLLQGVGITGPKLAKGMAGDLNALVRSAIVAGQKIPASFRPIIEELIRMGGLTEENRRLMLGLSETSSVTFEQVTEAASRYGLEIDALGPKIQQLQISESAEQIVADWELLIGAGADFNSVLVGMADETQVVVTNALKFGSELPEKMKPMIQAMIDAGLLTDLTGEKLIDISQLNWAEPLAESVDRLITKMDELIEKIIEGVGGAIDSIDGSTIDINANVNTNTNTEVQEPAYYAKGGVVVPFRPRGTDTVPAMLTPGERVIPRGAGGGTAIIELEGRTLAEVIVPEIPGVERRYGVRR